MKPIKKRFAFVVRSMSWSLLFYVVLMLAFNWEEISSKISGSNTVVVANTNVTLPQQIIPQVTNPETYPTVISSHMSVLKSIAAIAQTIIGIRNTAASR